MGKGKSGEIVSLFPFWYNKRSQTARDTLRRRPKDARGEPSGAGRPKACRRDSPAAVIQARLKSAGGGRCACCVIAKAMGF